VLLSVCIFKIENNLTSRCDISLLLLFLFFDIHIRNLSDTLVLVLLDDKKIKNEI